MRRDAIGLQVTLDVEGRHAVVVGAGAEAEDKVARLLDAGAWVTVVAAEPGEAILGLARASRVMLVRHEFVAEDVESADLVLVCERDEAVAERARLATAATGAALWVMDLPEASDLAMPALARLGTARLAISTGGAAPALAAKVRGALERDLGERFARFVARLGEERERLRAAEPDGDKRRAALRALVEGFELRVEARYPDDEA